MVNSREELCERIFSYFFYYQLVMYPHKDTNFSKMQHLETNPSKRGNVYKFLSYGKQRKFFERKQ